jgi:hypothetical protein
MEIRAKAVAAGIAATLALSGAAATPAWAKGGPPGKGESRKVEAAKARRQARFVAVGVVKSATGDGLVVTVKGGNRKDFRKSDVTFSAGEHATIKRDGKAVTLEALQPGDHVMVQGSTKDGKNVATKFRAQSPKPKADSKQKAETGTEGADD